MKFVIATNNKKKLKELSAILETLGIEAISLKEAGIESDVEETGTTFEENARLKAENAMRISGLPAVADDSGLEVDALGGEPGIYSARYASKDGLDADDNDNNALLLKNLQGKENRDGQFVAAVAFISADTSFVKRGEVKGRILHEAKGNGGFGYDPLFFSYEANECFGVLPREEKNKISHRARAFEALAKVLNEKYGI